MNRITTKMLDQLVDQINIESCVSREYSSNTPGTPFKANIGHYHLDGAYGGTRLVRVCNESGGIHVISKTGYTTKRALYNELVIFLANIKGVK